MLKHVSSIGGKTTVRRCETIDSQHGRGRRYGADLGKKNHKKKCNGLPPDLRVVALVRIAPLQIRRDHTASTHSTESARKYSIVLRVGTTLESERFHVLASR